MSITYGQEKFSTAVHTLATNPGRIRERLAAAWIYSLNNVDPDRDLPSQLQADFRAQATKIRSGTPTGQEGTIRAFTDTLSEDEAMERAAWIVATAYELDDY